MSRSKFALAPTERTSVDEKLLGLLISVQFDSYRGIVSECTDRKTAENYMDALMTYHFGGWTAFFETVNKSRIPTKPLALPTAMPEVLHFLHYVLAHESLLTGISSMVNTWIRSLSVQHFSACFTSSIPISALSSI